MKKTITICNMDFEVAVNAATLFLYKKTFHRDGLNDLFKLGKLSVSKKADLIEQLAESDIELDFVYRFLYIMVGSANKDIPNFEEFLIGIDAPPLDFAIEAIQKVIPLLTENMQTSVKNRKK